MTKMIDFSGTPWLKHRLDLFSVGPHDYNTAWIWLFSVRPHDCNTGWTCFQWDPMITTLPGLVFSGTPWLQHCLDLFSVGPHDYNTAWTLLFSVRPHDYNTAWTLLFSVGPHDYNTAWTLPGLPSSTVSSCRDLGQWRLDQRVHCLHSARPQHHLLCGQSLPPLPHCLQASLQTKGLVFYKNSSEFDIIRVICLWEWLPNFECKSIYPCKKH